MKLLFDENLAGRLVAGCEEMFPGSMHVSAVGLASATDGEIWSYAAARGFAIVTKDSDFRQRSFLKGHPPKVIWIRVGNCSTQTIEDLLRESYASIADFLRDPNAAFLALSHSSHLL